MDQPIKLTFKALNERIDQISEHPSVAIGISAREKYGYATALLAVALFFLSMKVLPDKLYTLVIACALLLVELVAVAITLIPHWPPRFPSFRSEWKEYADQLDYDFGHYGELMAWIVQFPRDHIADLADYAEMRQERFREKQPLLLGGVEKLGALPVLIAVAMQFRGMHWPPEIGWREIVAYMAAAWLYWLCLISISTRHRGRFMEIALKRALVIKDKQAVESTTVDAATPSVASVTDPSTSTATA